MVSFSSPRSAKWIAIATLLLAPLLVFCAFRAQASNSNNVRDWLPKRFEATQRLKWYVERFGSDEVLVISWNGCTIDDERLAAVAERLLQPQVDSQGRQRVLFREVVTGRSVLDRLTSEPLNLGEDQARERLRGWLLGDDGQTCVVGMVSLGPEQVYDRHAAVAAAERAIATVGLTPEQAFIAGPTADAVAIDRAGSENVAFLGIVAAFWGALLAWYCLGDAVKAITVFLVAKLAWATSLTIVYFSGQNMDAVLMTMPALVFVLAISGAIHLTHYFERAQGTSESTSKCTSAAVGRALRWGWLPCSLACATTAVGLVSLAISSVTPVVRFGTFSALGTFAVLAILLVVWPALTQLFAAWHRPVAESAPGKRWWRPVWRATSGWQPIVILVALSLPVLGLGISRLETSVRLSSLLPPKSALMQGYAALEASIGPIVPMEIVLEFSQADADPKTLLDRCQLVERIRHDVAALPDTGGAIAATTFAPSLPQESGARQVVVRRIVANKLAGNREMFQQLNLVKVHDGRELWRVSTRVATADSADYGRTLDALSDVVSGHLSSASPGTDTEITYRICGGVPLIYMAQQQLMNDLRQSFITAFGLIAIVMSLLLRSVAGGLLSMIPNLIPTLIVFGIMGLRRTPIDIGTMMTASVALGIAVDDTLHFLVWFRRGVERFQDRRQAIHFAYENCATAMLHTSLICGLGMLPFVFSAFQPIARFAGVLCALLFAALLGDLIVLPALLASPLGKFAVPRKTRAGGLPQSVRNTTSDVIAEV